MNAVLLDCAGVTAEKVFFALHHVGAGDGVAVPLYFPLSEFVNLYGKI